MRLATVRTDAGSRAARVEGSELVLLPFGDVGEALASAGWRDELPALDGERRPLADADLAPVITRPEKIICVGLNSAAHAAEANLPVPDYPPLFAKFWRSLVGARDQIMLPHTSEMVDWEVELAVVIGAPVRHVGEREAREAIAGFTILNDVSMRDWQLRTSEFLQGKTFEGSSPLGPELVTLDEFDDPENLRMICEVDGERMQDAQTSDLIVGPTQLISYISQIITLVPGDIIATGTPGGVGGAMDPPRFLSAGQTVRTSIEGIGELVNVCTPDPIVDELPAGAEA